MAPSNVRVVDIGNSWVLIAWDLHPELNETFEIVCSHENVLVKISQLKHSPRLIEGLRAATDYEIEIRASNNAGLGMPSRILKIHTMETGM